MSANEETKEESEAGAEEQAPSPSLPPETRAVGVFQDITETKSEEIVYALKIYSGESDSPVEFYVNSAGGVASDMFAIYDYMRQTREDMEIHTHGLGKVMSAAVLLLAAGTKGKRKIG
ncbi:MAG: hypothetical protein GKR86_01840, partial [Ilumatobacter sp.]|nr:hypothetical protein [Ilumatobacter sp.]